MALMRIFSVQGGGPKPGCQELRCEEEVRKDRPESDSLFNSRLLGGGGAGEKNGGAKKESEMLGGDVGFE